MHINTDINILGGLPDWHLVEVFIKEDIRTIQNSVSFHSITHIKTHKSVKRFEKAIQTTLINNKKQSLKHLIVDLIREEGITKRSLMILFWNASSNNDLLYHLNEKVLFPALYSGRTSIKNDEVEACIIELRQTEKDLKAWSDSTISTTASKYLTLLKKFGLMEGSVKKNILHPYLTDELFILFVYWVSAVSEKPNLLDSPWLLYCFNEKQNLLDRLLHKKFSKYYNVVYTGDKLNIEPLISYASIYEYITKS